MKLEPYMIVVINNENEYLDLMRMCNKRFPDWVWPWSEDKWRDWFYEYKRGFGSCAIRIGDYPFENSQYGYCQIEFSISNAPYIRWPIVEFKELEGNGIKLEVDSLMKLLQEG